MIHERKGGHFRRQYSAQAKKAGEAMMKVMRDFAEPLSVQDARIRAPSAAAFWKVRCAGARTTTPRWKQRRIWMRLQTLMSPMPKSPTYEETATGYAIAAMRMAELPPDTIQQVVAEMRVMIDKYSPAEAAQIATSSPY